ncbi:MAG: phenylalanine--tRNA ligase subunit beta [Bacteroidetes bacterium]|nr:phenylalanine--tRNA ligase subunit beta [Bacteroidota bacterium]
MKISSKWLKNYIDFDYNVEQLDNVLTMLGVEVESYEVLKNKYNGFYVGYVKDKQKHPKSEILSVCTVNIGNDDLTVVCGASNVERDQKVVVGTLGAIVPSNGLKLEKRTIRGVTSEGMICSQAELELGDDNLGIWVLPNDAPAGALLVNYLNIDDIILDISLTPNKADCASHLGIAREIAAHKRSKLKQPIDNVDVSKANTSNESINDYIKVNVPDSSLCPRYMAKVVKNVKNGKSPRWLRNELLKVGIRPINIVVDVTNWVLMDCGQPLHAFDLDKVAGNTINVKNGFANYKFTTLDSKEHVLDKDMLMICDAEKPIAIAGVMGGKNSEISDDTVNVVLESAYFNPVSVRRTSKKTAISTDASYRFERGTDVNMVEHAINKAANYIAVLTNGTIINEAIDIYPNELKPIELELDYEKTRKIIGTTIAAEEMKNIMTSLGFKVLKAGKQKIIVEVPQRRNDIKYPIDLVEEVARLIDYDSIQPVFTSNIDFDKVELPAILKPLPLRNKFRQYLTTNGFNEILTYNIVEPSSAELFTNKPITIANPLGEEMSVMRPSMITQMLKTISFNLKQGNQNLKLYETGKAFLPYNNISNSFIDGIDEREHLVIALVGNATLRQWSVKERKFDVYDIKGVVEDMLEFLKIKNVRIKPLEEDNKIFSNNAAKITINKNQIGYIGEAGKEILKKYDIEVPVFLASLDMTELSDLEYEKPHFEQLSPYPVMNRDLAFLIDTKYLASELVKTIKETASPMLKSIDVFDVYQGKNIADNKRSIGFSLVFSSNERTLTDSEVEEDINKIVKAIESYYGAELRKA